MKGNRSGLKPPINPALKGDGEAVEALELDLEALPTSETYRRRARLALQAARYRDWLKERECPGSPKA